MVKREDNNQYRRTVVAEYQDVKGHPLQSTWFRKRGNHETLKMINDVLYCPKCKLFFRVSVGKVKVVIK